MGDASVPAPRSALLEGAGTYDGLDGAALELVLDVPKAVVYDSVASTMDVAHARAADGAPAGTIVLADRQTRGRGRGGRAWISPPGQGIWLTLLERGVDVGALDVLSLRLGLAAAGALDAFAIDEIALKWPNDLLAGGAKVGGILVETRWRDMRLEWLAIGIGIDLLPVPGVTTAALRPGVARIDLLRALIPRLRAAAARVGVLDAAELADFGRRDAMRGRRCVEPARGTVLGISTSGELRVATGDGISLHREGSLVLEDSA